MKFEDDDEVESKNVHEYLVDDSDDDEEDEDDDNQNVEGLIDDNPIEEEESDDDDDDDYENVRKREHSDSEDYEDDFKLIEENTGRKLKRHKRRRIVMESDEEDDGKTGEGNAESPDYESRMEEDKHSEASLAEEDEDDFIVYGEEQDQPQTDAKKKKRRTYNDAVMQDAYEVFGGDFDFAELNECQDDEAEEDYDQEDEEVDVRVGKYSKKLPTAQQLFEPGALERAHLTSFDQQIRANDVPERFQLRSIAVCPSVEGELEEEAEWIYKHAFNTPPISRQDYFGSGHRKGPSTISKIREALNLMRNQKFEVPFIAFYRKEHIDPELNITDLWKIFHWDEKWMTLTCRKQNLVRLFEQMQQFQFEESSLDKPLDSSFRRLTEKDIERIKLAQTMEQLKDILDHFNLYYSNDVLRVKSFLKSKKEKMQEEGVEDPGNEEEPSSTIKHSKKKSGYNICVEAGLSDIVQRFGLTSEQFGENLRDNYQRHEVEQDPRALNELAVDFINGQFSSTEEVMTGARYIVAMQIAHDPLTKNYIRGLFYEKCMITVRLTPRGINEIDEGHPCFCYKYLKDKPIRDLVEDQFLKIHQAENDGFLTVEFSIDSKTSRKGYLEDVKQLYVRNEYSNLVQDWNKHRIMAVEKAFHGILYPHMIMEIRNKLLEESKEFVVKACCRKLYGWLKVAPYQVDQPIDEDDEDFDTSQGLRIMGIAYSDLSDESSYAAVIDGDGEVMDYLRLSHLCKKKNSYRKDERELKESDLNRIKDLIVTKKPHVIAVGAESRKVLMLVDDLKSIVSALEQEQQIAPVSVEIVDNELSRVYAASKKAEHDLKEYPLMLRQAVSIARRLQDPLIEFSQLCNPNEDIISLRFHPLQEYVSKDALLNNLYLEFVNRVNEVGVDLNRCIAHPHTANLIQFVCGLGPRKGYYLLKILKQSNSALENRIQLVTNNYTGMGPRVFINCAGFVKINASSIVDGNEGTMEVLDGSRVHPESYELARKMAVDALECDDDNNAAAVEEILENPERLKELDLDAFAIALEKMEFGNKHATLYDIRAELTMMYKEMRTPYRSPSLEETFNLLTKETPETFYIGKLVSCKVIGIAYKKPRADQMERANPVRSEGTGFWQCPFCQKNDFFELSDVRFHFGICQGHPAGVKTILDNGVSGFIPLRLLSDSHVSHPEERVKMNMMITCRISKIDIERFQVELTCKSSDLLDHDHKWNLKLDSHYDHSTEREDKKLTEIKTIKKPQQAYIKRVIAHPSFQNIDFQSCEKQMECLEQGDAIIRPSSKGSDHLTLTWKVGEGVVQHVDIREEGKSNPSCLGKSLHIGSESFEDLDEIIARYIQPMASFARDIMEYKYFLKLHHTNMDNRDFIEKSINEEKRVQPNRIPYYFSISKTLPGKFLLSFLPRRTTIHEYVTATSDGIRYRGKMFQSLPKLIKWFKEHCGDPMPSMGMSEGLTRY